MAGRWVGSVQARAAVLLRRGQVKAEQAGRRGVGACAASGVGWRQRTAGSHTPMSGRCPNAAGGTGVCACVFMGAAQRSKAAARRAVMCCDGCWRRAWDRINNLDRTDHEPVPSGRAAPNSLSL